MKKINIYRGKSVSLLIILLFFTATLSYGTTNLDVTVSEIFFNYQDGYTCDALTISDDGNPIVNSAEWDSWSLEQHKFAYIMNQSCRNIKVKLHPGLYDGIMHLIIKVSYASGYTDGIGTICNLFIPNYDTSKADGGLILPLTGNFPQSVGVHEFRWHWEIYAIPVNNPNYCAAWGYTDTSHHFYTLLAAPQEPMIHPWESVLDKACKWANGKTTPDATTTQITTSLYSCGYNYAISNGASSYSDIIDPSIIHLGNLINDFTNPTNILVNCIDLSRATVIFCNALGTHLKAIRFNNSFGYVDNFPVNCIDLIGSNATITNDPFYTRTISSDCRAGGFSLHAFATDSSISKVWDATLRYDIDSDPDNVSNPNNSGCGVISSTSLFVWELPCNVPISNYLENLVDDYVKQNDNINKYCNDPLNCGNLTVDNFSIFN